MYSFCSVIVPPVRELFHASKAIGRGGNLGTGSRGSVSDLIDIYCWDYCGRHCGGLHLCKVDRRKVAEGSVHVITCAVRKDGQTSPASDVLDQLASESWENPNSPELPDDRQIELHDELFAICEDFAEYGLPQNLYDINQIDYGMWEFKTGWLRAAFFDTDGNGNYEPKVTNFSLSNQVWEEIPEFSEHIRIAVCMSKKHQMSVPKELAFSRQVRQEDLHHDKAAS